LKLFAGDNPEETNMYKYLMALALFTTACGDKEEDSGNSAAAEDSAESDDTGAE
jgi:hypothetical protein